MMNIYIVGLNQLSDVEIDKVTCVLVCVCFLHMNLSLVLRSLSLLVFAG